MFLFSYIWLTSLISLEMLHAFGRKCTYVCKSTNVTSSHNRADASRYAAHVRIKRTSEIWCPNRAAGLRDDFTYLTDPSTSMSNWDHGKSNIFTDSGIFNGNPSGSYLNFRYDACILHMHVRTHYGWLWPSLERCK